MMNRRTTLPLLILLLLFWFTRLENSAILATQADEGVHLAVAELVAFHERTIYSDLFENRTPAVEWLLAGWFRLVDAHIFSARVLTIAVSTLTGAMMYGLARRASSAAGASKRLGYVAGAGALALYLVDPLALRWSRFVMLEHFAAAAALAAILVALRAHKTRSAKGWFISGLLTGLAILFKQTEIVLLGTIGAFLLLQRLQKGTYAALRPALFWATGLLMTMTLFLSVLILQGSLSAFLLFASHAGQLAPFANLQEKALEFLAWLQQTPALWLLAPALLVTIRRAPHSLQLVYLWFGAEIAFLFLPPQLDLSPGGFSHYAIPVIAAASVAASSGIVGAWERLANGYRGRTLLAVAVMLFATLQAPQWRAAFTDALFGTDYPQATIDQERTIARSAALLAEDDQTILVLGNSIFYHYTQREPASRFFHWPDFLAQSALVDLATDSVSGALQDEQMAVALVSRLHLEERVPDELRAALWRSWTPVTLLPYAYQRDMLLFVPRAAAPDVQDAVAGFDNRIQLLSLDASWPGPRDLLVRLWWRAERIQEGNYTVFVHLLDDQGTLLAQDDRIPVVGFRPIDTWQEGEAVLDYHWLTLPEDVALSDLHLSVGLYDATSGERLPLAGGVDGADALDAYQRPLRPNSK